MILADSTLDFSTSAGLHSQFTGVLASFAFGGFIALVSARINSTSGLSASLPKAYLPLLAAFVGLVATSLDYATAAADKANSVRTASVELSSAIGFVASAIMVFYSIIALLRVVEGNGNGPHGTSTSTLLILEILVTAGVCPIAMLLFAGAIADFSIAKYGLGGANPGIEFAGWACFAIVAAMGVAAVLVIKFCEIVHPRIDYLKEYANSGISIASLCVSLLSVVATSFMFSYFEGHGTLSDLIILFELALTLIFVIAAQWAIALTARTGQGPQQSPVTSP